MACTQVMSSTAPAAWMRWPSMDFTDENGTFGAIDPGAGWGSDAGKGIGVALVDTGVADTPDLAGRLVRGPDLSGEGDGIDRYGHGTFWSEDAAVRSHWERWMDWAQTSLQPDFLTGVFWGFYRTPPAQRDMVAVEEKIRRCAQHFQLLDAMLADRPFLLGERLKHCPEHSTLRPGGAGNRTQRALNAEQARCPKWVLVV